jgi:hypothetical protein
VNPEADSPLFYYCHDGVTVEGPHYWEQILELYEVGAVSAETSICMAGHEEWTTLGSWFPSAEESDEEALPGATMIHGSPYDQSHSPAGAQADGSFVSRHKKWMAVAGALLFSATTAYFGLRFFQREVPVEEAVGVATAADESEAERWVWAIEPRYDEALPFELFGVAPVRMGRKWGMIDRAGRELLPCAYDEIEVFPKEECAAVRKGADWGLVDAQGKTLVEPAWEEMQPLVNGFIPVKKDGKWGYADASGKLVIPCTWDNAWRFSAAGTAVVTEQKPEGRKRGYIDKTGRVITPLEWDGAQSQVAEGFGAVRRGNGWALVDKNGKVLGEPQWEMQWRFLRADLGFMPVCKDGKWGILGLDGAVLVEPAWDSIAPGANGVLLFKPGEKSIFVGSGGQTVVETGPWDEVRGLSSPFDWSETPGFSEGFLAVRSGDKWGFINEQGETVIPAEWDAVDRFSEGLVAVMKRKEDGVSWTYLGTDGAPAFAKPEDLELGGSRFRDGKAQAERSDASSVFIDREGKVVGEWSRYPWLPPGVTVEGSKFGYVSRYGRYGRMRNFADAEEKIFMRDVPVEMSSLDDPFPYPGQPRYGLANVSGQVLVEPKWDRAEIISPDWVRVWLDDLQGLVSARGEQILQTEWDEVAVAKNGLLLARDGRGTQVFDQTGKPLLPTGLESVEYVDFYADGFVVRSKGPDGSTLWSLCDPAQPQPVSFKNAARVYWTGGMAENGLIWIEERDGGEWSLIKRDGTPLGISQNTQPSKWHMFEGFGVLTKDDGTMVHIDAAGQQLGTQTWQEASFFRHGLAAVATGGKSGFLGKDGELVIPAQWTEVRDFQNVGSDDAPVLLARVSGLSGKPDNFLKYEKPDGANLVEIRGSFDDWQTGHPLEASTDDAAVVQIDLKSLNLAEGKYEFKFLVDGKFEDGENRTLQIGADGLVSEERWGCVDGSGRMIVEPQWDEIGPFVRLGDGRFVASVRRGELWGIIDQSGAVCVEPCAQGPAAVEDGVVRLDVKKEGQEYGGYVFYDTNWAEIDWRAAEALRKSWPDPLGQGMEIYNSSEGSFGLRDDSGQIVAAPKWDHIVWIGPRVAAAWNENEGGIFDAAGKALFRDDAKRRLARFDRPGATFTPSRYQRGLVVIEATPVWGYAKLADAKP